MDEAAVSVEGLCKSYGRGAKRLRAVDGVSFAVPRGSVVGLLGPNGAGKTTVIKCILGLVTPDAGEVRILGADVRREPLRAYRHVASVLEGSRNVYWRLTVRENLEFFASLMGVDPRRRRPFLDELLERFDLASRQHATVNDLSRGMKQKVAIACAFAREAEVLFLDEPTLGLDLATARQLQATLKELAREHGRTIVLSSHDMDVVEDLCARVVILSAGRVVVDDEVRNLVALFRAEAYRIEVVGELPQAACERLRERFRVRAWEGSPAGTSFEVELADAGELYEVVDRIREFGAPLRAIARSEPDLAEVFLRVTSSRGQLLPEREAAEAAREASSP